MAKKNELKWLTVFRVGVLVVTMLSSVVCARTEEVSTVNEEAHAPLILVLPGAGRAEAKRTLEVSGLEEAAAGARPVPVTDATVLDGIRRAWFQSSLDQDGAMRRRCRAFTSFVEVLNDIERALDRNQPDLADRLLREARDDFACEDEIIPAETLARLPLLKALLAMRQGRDPVEDLGNALGIYPDLRLEGSAAELSTVLSLAHDRLKTRPVVDVRIVKDMAGMSMFLDGIAVDAGTTRVGAGLHFIQVRRVDGSVAGGRALALLPYSDGKEILLPPADLRPPSGRDTIEELFIALDEGRPAPRILAALAALMGRDMVPWVMIVGPADEEGRARSLYIAATGDYQLHKVYGVSKRGARDRHGRGRFLTLSFGACALGGAAYYGYGAYRIVWKDEFEPGDPAGQRLALLGNIAGWTSLGCLAGTVTSGFLIWPGSRSTSAPPLTGRFRFGVDPSGRLMVGLRGSF